MKIETKPLFLREMNEADHDALYPVPADREIMQHYPYPFDEERIRKRTRICCACAGF